MSLSRRVQLTLWLTLVLITGIALMEAGVYGWMLFAIVPFALGLVVANIAHPSTGGRAAVLGAGTVLAGSFFLLVFAFDGAVCIVMALPIVLPLGSLGAMGRISVAKA